MGFLVAINLFEEYQEILDQAICLSKALSTQLTLIYVESLDPSMVIEGGGPLLHLNRIISERIEENQEKLEKLVKSLKKEGINADYSIEKGVIPQAIIQKAKELSSSMIIIGSHGNTLLMDLLTGSTHEGVLHRAECPVLVVPCKS